MKPIFTLILIAAATPAMAHPSHVAEVSGHDHIVAIIAVSVAIVVALVSGLKARHAAKLAV